MPDVPLHQVQTDDLWILGYQTFVKIPNVHPDDVPAVTNMLREILSAGTTHAFATHLMNKIQTEENDQ